jgi:hypothetical protein
VSSAERFWTPGSAFLSVTFAAMTLPGLASDSPVVSGILVNRLQKNRFQSRLKSSLSQSIEARFK